MSTIPAKNSEEIGSQVPGPTCLRRFLLSGLRLTLVCFLALNISVGIRAEKPFRNLEKRLPQLIEATPAIARGYLGYEIANAETGAVLAEENAQKFLNPASNTKLYTIALALERLGANYRFQTQLRTASGWTPGQTVLKDLQLVGGGDPELSGRVLPYDVNAHDGDPLTPLNELADKLFALGIREIDGDITGVSTRYANDFYPNGWTLDDSIYGYGAPITALVVNDNTISATVHPSAPGELAVLELSPNLSDLIFLNQVITDASRSSQIQIAHPAGSAEIILRGSIGAHAPAWKEDFAVPDPARFAAQALIEVLRAHGMTVRGSPRAEYCGPGEYVMPSNTCDVASTVLTSHESPPLSEIVRVINKVSDNLGAEMLLREVAHVTTGSGTLAAGLKAREDFLAQIGITRDESGFAFADGSGLARQNLTTPHSTVSLLRYMWRQPDRQTWLDSFPIGGVDGSLQHRFHNRREASRVHAKTGSLTHVNTLSGYVETKTQGWLALSVMVNSTAAPEAQVRDFLDAFCALLLDY